MKNLKKEIQSLKDSNENHIFINEKLNAALKKSNQRVEELERQAKEQQEKHKDQEEQWPEFDKEKS